MHAERSPRDHAHPPVSGTERNATGAVLVGLAALLLLWLLPVAAVPTGIIAVWLGVRAVRANATTPSAVAGIMLGALAAVLAVAGIGGLWMLQRVAADRMPELVAASQPTLEPQLHRAAEVVFPCQGLIDRVELHELWTDTPALDGSAAPTIDTANAARATVVVNGDDVDVWLRIRGQGYAATSGTPWAVSHGERELTLACEALAGDH